MRKCENAEMRKEESVTAESHLEVPLSHPRISEFPHFPPAILFSVPGNIQRLTGGSLYDRKLAESLRERGFRLEVATAPDLPYFLGLLAGAFISPWLLFRLARTKYDVVVEDGWAHPTLLLFNFVCSLIARLRLVVVVHQVRWREISPLARFICRCAERQMLRSARTVVVVSQFVKGEVERLVGSGSAS